MSQRFWILLYLGSLSLFHPTLFYFYFHTNLKNTSHRYWTKFDPHHPDKKGHERWIYEAANNIKNFRVGTLSIIDEKQPQYSNPRFQYYGIFFYHILGAIHLLVGKGDFVLTFFWGLLIFWVGYVVGCYLLLRRNCDSLASNLLMLSVVTFFPYFSTQIFSFGTYVEHAAILMLPMVCFLWIRFLDDKNQIGIFSVHFIFMILVNIVFLTLHPLIVGISIGILLMFLFWQMRNTKLLGSVCRQSLAKKYLRAIFPLLLIVLGSLFFWIPVLRDGKDVIVTLGNKLPERITQSWFQNGWLLLPFPAHLVSEKMALFSPQTGGLYLIVLASLFKMKSLASWLQILVLLIFSSNVLYFIFPFVLKIIHHPFRLLGFCPILLLFQGKAFSKKELISILCAFALFTPLFYLKTPTLKLAQTDFSVAPAVLSWEFYPAHGASVPTYTIDRSQINVEKKSFQNPKKTFLIWTEPVQSPAINYKVMIQTPTAPDRIFTMVLYLQYPDGAYRLATLADISHSQPVILSACSQGAHRAYMELRAVGEGEVEPINFNLEKIAESKSMEFIHKKKYKFPVYCDFKWNDKKHGFQFDIRGFEKSKEIIIPVYFSPGHVYLDSNNKSLNASGFSARTFSSYLNIPLSFSVVEVSKNQESILVIINGNNPFKVFSPLVWFDELRWLRTSS